MVMFTSTCSIWIFAWATLLERMPLLKMGTCRLRPQSVAGYQSVSITLFTPKALSAGS